MSQNGDGTGVTRAVQGGGFVTAPPVELWNSAQFTSSWPLFPPSSQELTVILKALETSFINVLLKWCDFLQQLSILLMYFLKLWYKNIQNTLKQRWDLEEFAEMVVSLDRCPPQDYIKFVN